VKQLEQHLSIPKEEEKGREDDMENSSSMQPSSDGIYSLETILNILSSFHSGKASPVLHAIPDFKFQDQCPREEGDFGGVDLDLIENNEEEDFDNIIEQGESETNIFQRLAIKRK